MEGLPDRRISSSLKKMDMPFRVTRRMFWEPVVSRTRISSSPSFNVIARRPFRRTFRYSAAGVFLIRPSLVAMTMNLSRFSSRWATIAVTFSPGCSCTRLMMGVPRLTREASGIS